MPKRKFISIVDKATAINNIKNGKERKIVEEELGVGLSTIVGWMKVFIIYKYQNINISKK